MKSNNDNNIFFKYLKSEETRKFLIAPVINSYVTASILNLKWLSDVSFEDKIKVFGMCNIDKIVYPIDPNAFFGKDHPLSWNEEIIFNDGRIKIHKLTIGTPFGELNRTIKEIKGVSLIQTDSPIKEKDDLKKMIWWLKEARKYKDYIRIMYENFKNKIGVNDLLVFQAPLPFEIMWWIPREDAIFYSADWPDIFKEAGEQIMETQKCLIDAAIKGGANLVFFGSPGTELISEKIFLDYFLEPSRCLSELAKESNVLSIFHCCGKSKTWIDKGFINDINPDIFESLTPEPLGDISDENSYRKKLDKNICTRGGLSLEMLRIGNRNEIENSLMQIKKNYSDYKHMISGTCETLYGTPLGNINILSKIAERLEIRFG